MNYVYYLITFVCVVWIGFILWSAIKPKRESKMMDLANIKPTTYPSIPKFTKTEKFVEPVSPIPRAPRPTGTWKPTPGVTYDSAKPVVSHTYDARKPVQRTVTNPEGEQNYISTDIDTSVPLPVLAATLGMLSSSSTAAADFYTSTPTPSPSPSAYQAASWPETASSAPSPSPSVISYEAPAPSPSIDFGTSSGSSDGGW